MVKNIIAIDPGTTESAIVMWDGDQMVVDPRKIKNDEVFNYLYRYKNDHDFKVDLVIEMVASYGMAVGKEVFETCVWIGRFAQYWSDIGSGEAALVFRKEVKMHLCGQTRAKDANIRQALVDRFGDKGTKAKKGLTYGLKADTWQAFALAVVCFDKPELLLTPSQLTDRKTSKKITIKKKK